MVNTYVPRNCWGGGHSGENYVSACENLSMPTLLQVFKSFYREPILNHSPPDPKRVPGGESGMLVKREEHVYRSSESRRLS